MKPIKINLLKLLKKYKSGWVGISDNFSKVIVNGRSLKEVREKALHLKKKVYYFPAGEKYSEFMG